MTLTDLNKCVLIQFANLSCTKSDATEGERKEGREAPKEEYGGRSERGEGEEKE